MVSLKVRAEDSGEAADRRRARFAGSQDPRPFAAWLQHSFPGAELTAEPILRLIPSRDPTIIELEAVVPKSALESGGGIAIYPEPLNLAGRVVPTTHREGPLVVAVRPDLEWILDVELGHPPGNLPESITLSGDHGLFRLETESTEKGYRIKGYIHLEPGLVDAGQAAELREFLLEVERILARPLETP
jgi:hypothetical protein